jgi:Co/Zn/Cd efflux system component
MAGCCDNDCHVDALRARQSATLRMVLAINAAMFLVLVGAALYSRSTALLSDSLDNLGDAVTYALSLYAVTRDGGTKARVALFKGVLILGAALVVLAQIGYRLAVPAVPLFEAMGAATVLALAANGACLVLLTRHREDDVNMSSVWECSRNDIASNLAVLGAAAAVWLTGSGWPDVLIALALAILFLRSALRVLTRAWRELRVEQRPA